MPEVTQEYAFGFDKNLKNFSVFLKPACNQKSYRLIIGLILSLNGDKLIIKY
jgi:hypothetical protein